ncbi:transglutaminase family protein [Salinisphaera sp. T31B1]|uniref:transglutaminase-like domain-containing protein n=1 Tax=Salinisphaera sp. T31B1 TaxID=727963 RepID=UPI003340776F
MWLRTRCELTFDFAVATPLILMLRPHGGAEQWVGREEYRLEPYVHACEFTDSYGNLCQRLTAPADDFTIVTSADVQVVERVDTAPGAPFVDIESLPDDVLIYLLPSRYCESDRFGQMAAEIAAGHTLGYDQVAAIAAWLRHRIRYVPGSSDVPISAVDVNLRQAGVCRDLSHLGIALCRGLSIPARLVVGYLHALAPMDMHAWFEAYVGGRWYTFDATQPGSAGGYVAIGYGRDAADVAIFNQFGPPANRTSQQVTVERLD